MNKILFSLLLLLMFVSCERNYDAPPLTEPAYTGNKANITIAELKELYASATDAVTINDDYILRARVAGNDESGNIYKQMVIQDETGGISIGVDQNSVYNTYRVGQEVYILLNGLCISSYGGELQLGYPGAYLNRTPWEKFQEHIIMNGWPDKSKPAPLIVNDFSKLNAIAGEVAFTLVKLNNVYFVNGGKNTFAPAESYGSEVLKDSKGNSMTVRTSSFASFAATKLPLGTGSVLGILGRYNGSWQLTIRSAADILTFDGEAPTGKPEEPVAGTFFNETFGSGFYPSGSRPKIAEFTDADMKSPIVYSDASGMADIRSMSGDNGAHVWFPSNKDSYFTIKGINTSAYASVKLSFQLCANLYNAGDAIDLNVVGVSCNGRALTLPATPVSNANGDNNKFYTFEISGINIAADVTIEFHSVATTNTLGLRLDNIKLTGE